MGSGDVFWSATKYYLDLKKKKLFVVKQRRKNKEKNV